MHFSDGTLHESELELLVSYSTLRAGVAQGLYTSSALADFRRKNEDRLNRVAFVLRTMRKQRRALFRDFLRDMN